MSDEAMERAIEAGSVAAEQFKPTGPDDALDDWVAAILEAAAPVLLAPKNAEIERMKRAREEREEIHSRSYQSMWARIGASDHRAGTAEARVERLEKALREIKEYAERAAAVIGLIDRTLASDLPDKGAWL